MIDRYSYSNPLIAGVVIFILISILNAAEVLYRQVYEIIIKSLDPSRAKNTFIIKNAGHTMVSANMNLQPVKLQNYLLD